MGTEIPNKCIPHTTQTSKKISQSQDPSLKTHGRRRLTVDSRRGNRWRGRERYEEKAMTDGQWRSKTSGEQKAHDSKSIAAPDTE
jgi:hypothetical protein